VDLVLVKAGDGLLSLVLARASERAGKTENCRQRSSENNLVSGPVVVHVNSVDSREVVDVNFLLLSP
jgi:hypothetical protein